MRSVIDDRSLLEADWPATKPGQEAGPDDTDLARFAAPFAYGAPPDEVVVAIQAAGSFGLGPDAFRGEPSACTQVRLRARCELVWPRLCRRWRLIETGLAEVAAGAFGREALRYYIALQDAWQRFDGEPEEREALLELYGCLVSRLAWPTGFTRDALLEAYQLD